MSQHSDTKTIFELPLEVRNQCRANGDKSPSDTTVLSQTSGQAPGFAQANLVILTGKDLAFDFLLFCQRNPKPCPLIAMLEAGQYLYRSAGSKHDIDIRTDLPKYRIFKDGTMTEEVRNLKDQWRDDFYTFIIGCSFSFEDALIG